MALSARIEYGGRVASWESHPRAHGINPATVRSRIRLGWTAGQALGAEEAPQQRKSDHLVYFRGEYKPMVVWAQELGISSKILNERMIHGMTSEQALSMPAQTSHSRDHIGAQRCDLSVDLHVIATECGVTRQAIEQTQLRAQGKVFRSLIAAKCMAWSSASGETLNDDEISDIIVALTDDADLRRQLRDGDFDVAVFCKAMLRMRAVAA